MIPDGARVRRLFLLPLALAAPAAAQYRRTGLLAWTFDDMTVNSGAGRVHAAKWAQAYSLNLDGPLFNPNIGEMHDGFSYSKGASISQAANTGIPNQELTTFKASGDLFNTGVRRFIRFSPNFSRSYLHQTGETPGGAYANTVADTAWGFSTGLSLPRLPALSYSRQASLLNNPLDISPVRMKSTTESKSASYFLGHVVVNASDQTDRVDDLTGATRRQENDYRQASLEANFYEPKWVKLQSLFFRTNVSENTSNGVTSQKQGIMNCGLFTQKFQTGRWESALSYGADASRDFMRQVDVFSHNASLNSTRPLRFGTLGNSVALTHSPSNASESAGDSLSLNQLYWRGLLGTSLGASGAWTRSPSGETLADGLSGRLDLYPAFPRNYFAEARTSGSEALAGSGGNRINRYSLGANDRSNRVNATARLDRTDSRYYATGTRAVSDQLNLEASGRPNAKLYASAGYSLGVVGAPGGYRSVSHNLHGSLDYSPTRGVNLAASGTYVGTGYTTAASASYSVGKTTLKISYDYRKLRTYSSFSHLSISLTRLL